MSRTLAAEIASERGPQQRHENDVIHLLNEARNLVQPLLPSGQRLVFQSDIEHLVLPMTTSEAVWVQIVLFSLLHNASKYGPTPGEIKLNCGAGSNHATIAVADQGGGVAPENKIHVFDPGFRAANIGKAEGLGLGLYEVKRLLDLLQWQIHLDDEVPHGARFEIWIPLDWRKENGRTKAEAAAGAGG